ncbi:hypothetical protein GCM10022403_032880 [Streptomyces coacervatus]|uniref:DUF2637 domain-containing protein n=1 Tax=Streptomyces coacervatus TaxID=647381 RepID=A0ABP7HMB1_9ACTN|nr:hypothetical protein [Streptomyces coacervatus]MDF2272378.1 hypothetical protein [Streptomyces coacervatus]
MKMTETSKLTIQTETTSELKSIIRTRRLVDSMMWTIAAGAILFSLMTGSPLVSAHSHWAWTGWILPLLVDAALVLSLSADSILSRHGVHSGHWPTAFRWITGVASLFLNCWSSLSSGDWVGVAVHSIAPVVLICAAEVAPVYRRKFHEIELSLSDQVQEFTVTRAVSKKKTVAKDSTPLTTNQQAIRDGFLAGKKAGVLAEEIGVSPSYVYTQYRKMKDELDLTA